MMLDKYGDNAKSQIGVIAQELEVVQKNKLVTESELKSKSDILSNSEQWYTTDDTSDGRHSRRSVIYI